MKAERQGAVRAIPPVQHDDGSSMVDVDAQTHSLPVPPGWEHRQHEGTVFFENVVTGEKQWTHPALILPAGWAQRDNDGTAYFENLVTGETQWVRPFAAEHPTT